MYELCVCVCVFINLHITAQSGPVILATRIDPSKGYQWCVCVFVIPFILDVRFVDVPAGVTQEKGYTGFLHLPSPVLALIFLAGRIQPFLSFVDREVEFCVLTIWTNRSPLVGHFFVL